MMPRTPTSFGTNRGAAAKNIVSQGLVTMNVGSGERIVAERRADKSATRFAPDASYNGDAFAAHHVYQYQPLMVSRQSTKRSLVQSLTMHSVGALTLEPFATFNGFNHGNRTREEIEEDIDVIGFAGTPYTYGEATQNDGGLAAIIAGSFTTQNTGTSSIVPGQLLQWKAYDMRDTADDKAALEAFHAKRRQTNAVSNSQPYGRYQPRIEPFDAQTEVRLSFYNALRAELDAAAASPAAADALLNFDALDNEATLRKLPMRRRMVMQKLRADFLIAMVMTTGLAPSPLVNKTNAERVTAFRHAYGIISTGNAAVDKETARACQVSYGIAVDAMNMALRKVIAVSIGYSLPGGNVDVVV